MSVSIIYATNQRGVVGVNGGLPWHSKQDLARFKLITRGSMVIMGRRTFESIGKPLSGRMNVILSSTMKSTDDYFVFRHPSTILSFARGFPNSDIYIIGGPSLWEYYLDADVVDWIYESRMFNEVGGDTFFDFNKNPNRDRFHPVSQETYEDHIFRIIKRKR